MFFNIGLLLSLGLHSYTIYVHIECTYRTIISWKRDQNLQQSIHFVSIGSKYDQNINRVKFYKLLFATTILTMHTIHISPQRDTYTNINPPKKPLGLKWPSTRIQTMLFYNFDAFLIHVVDGMMSFNRRWVKSVKQKQKQKTRMCKYSW